MSKGQSLYLRFQMIPTLAFFSLTITYCTLIVFLSIFNDMPVFAFQVIAEQISRQCVQRLPCAHCGVATHKSTLHHRNLCLMSTP